jgi:geranylgeranyl pyrophosphate synthase
MPIKLHAINEELSLVDAKIRKELIINKSGNAGQFSHLEFSRFDSIIRPAITILVGKLFSFNKNKLVALASIFQFIYMSSQIHARITEGDADVDDVRDGCQFPVLVGDYLSGKFFCHLTDQGMLEYLSPLAEIICRINEGAALRNQYPNVNINSSPELALTIIRKETAELFAGCSSLAAKISGATEADVKRMYEFGLNFGIGLGLLEQGAAYEYVEKYINTARTVLNDVCSSQTINELTDLLSLFEDRDLVFQRMVG